MSAIGIFFLTLLVAMVPVIELKGAIPMGVAWAHQAGFAMSPWFYFAAALIGSCIPAFIITPLLKPTLVALGKTKLFAGLARKIDAHFEKKALKVEQKSQLRAEKRRAEIGDDYTEEMRLVDEKKYAKRLSFFKYLSVFLFVAIPLPLTGCWTGSAVAVFLGTKARYSLPCIVVGNVVAGLIIMLITLFVGDIFIPGGF